MVVTDAAVAYRMCMHYICISEFTLFFRIGLKLKTEPIILVHLPFHRISLCNCAAHRLNSNKIIIRFLPNVLDRSTDRLVLLGCCCCCCWGWCGVRCRFCAGFLANLVYFMYLNAMRLSRASHWNANSDNSRAGLCVFVFVCVVGVLSNSPNTQSRNGYKCDASRFIYLFVRTV